MTDVGRLETLRSVNSHQKTRNTTLREPRALETDMGSELPLLEPEELTPSTYPLVEAGDADVVLGHRLPSAVVLTWDKPQKPDSEAAPCI